MITVTIETRENAVTRRVRLTATSVRRALELAGGPAKNARLFVDPAAHRSPDSRLAPKVRHKPAGCSSLLPGASRDNALQRPGKERDMGTTQYATRAVPAPGTERAAEILRESAIVTRAIARHAREAALQGRTREAEEMRALDSGVSRIALDLTATLPYPGSSAA